MKFYTNVFVRGQKIFHRYIENGKPHIVKEDFEPTLYSPTNNPTPYKSIYGGYLSPTKFENIREMKNHIETYKDVESFSISGMENPLYQFIAEKYKDEVEFDESLLNIVNIDIETTSANGFPDPIAATEEVNAITAYNFKTGKYTVFGNSQWGEVTITDDDKTYIAAPNEKELLLEFLDYWRRSYPDIVTGWNIDGFDTPYLYNRIRNVLGESAANELSPYKIVYEKPGEDNFGRPTTLYNIKGIASLDYLKSYKKFGYRKHSDWKLDTIGYEVAGIAKLDTGVIPGHKMYLHDYQKFIEYNIRDVEIVKAIEYQKKLLKLIITTAYISKINFEDVFSPVNTWDAIIYNFLLEKNIIIPPKDNQPSGDFPGAFVRETIPGKHLSVVTYDFTSMYPSIIMGCNISPETLVTDNFQDFDIDEHLDLEFDMSKFKDDDLSFCASGFSFSKDKRGILGEVTSHMFSKRKHYKGLMLDIEKEIEIIKAEKADSKEAKSLMYEKNALHSSYDTMQMGVKILLNSLYGATSNRWFRYFDLRLAKSITLQGQFIAKFIAHKVNTYLAPLADYKHDPVIGGDTDSIFISLEPIVKKIVGDKEVTELQKIDIMDKIAKKNISPRVDKWLDDFSDYCNSFEQKMFMDREVLASVGLYIAKKKYALQIYDNEGVRYAEPKKKVKGIETVKSSSPEWVKDKLNKVLDIVLNGNEKTLQDYIESVKLDFDQLPPEKFAISMTTNGINKYTGTQDEFRYKKGTGAHAKASINFNYFIKKKNLTEKYELIKDGDKIKYVWLTTNNPIKDTVIGFMDVLPPELHLHDYVDYEHQFVKVFTQPITNIIKVLGWTTKAEDNLEEFF